jgi:hypothetical protein
MTSASIFFHKISRRIGYASASSTLVLLLASACSAQNPQNQEPDKKPSSQNVPAAEESQNSPTLKETIHKKKVLTEDDLHPQQPHKFGDDEPAEFNPICNPKCEQLVRDHLQLDDSSELEFRNRFAVATQQIDDDTKWGRALVDAIHAADAYCDLEQNKARYAYKWATPPFTSDKMPYDFIVKERDAYYKFKELEGNVKVLIQNMQRVDGFRAVVMQSVWDVALERSCRGVEHL